MWDLSQWRALRDGPARRLSDALERTGATAELVESVLSTYLLLSSDALQRGQLGSVEAAWPSLFSRVWTELIPEALPRLPPDRALPVLGQAWDAVERYATAPGWLERLLSRSVTSATDVSGLATALSDSAQKCIEAPRARLDAHAHPRVARMVLESFLPGTMHWVAPRALCIHTRDPAALGRSRQPRLVWIEAAPEVLGAVACEEVPARVEVAPDMLALFNGAAPSEMIATHARNSAFAAAVLENGELLLAMPVVLATVE